MALSMSVSADKHNARHNTDLSYRAKLSNVDSRLSSRNVVLTDEAIGKAYDRLFGEAAERYNSTQREKGHPERQIDDYLAHIERSWRDDQAKVKAGKKGRTNVPQPCYEYVIQIGNHETWKSVPRRTLTEIYSQAFERVKDKTAGAIDWFQAVIHYDEPEGSGHMHIAGIPYGTGNKRGLETQVSMSQALKNLGLQRLPDLQSLMMRELEKVAHEHGIERDVMECDRPHLDVAAWKQAQRDTADMVARLEQKTEQVAELDGVIDDKEHRITELALEEHLTSNRLERLRQREEQEAAAIVELEGEIEAEGCESSSEGREAAEGARGAEEREERLRRQISRLKSEINKLENENKRAGERAGELEQGLSGLREQHQKLRDRFGELEQRVTAAIDKLREVPETLSELALDIAEKLGKQVCTSPVATMATRSLSDRAKGSQKGSEALYEQRRRESPERGFQKPEDRF